MKKKTAVALYLGTGLAYVKVREKISGRSMGLESFKEIVDKDTFAKVTVFKNPALINTGWAIAYSTVVAGWPIWAVRRAWKTVYKSARTVEEKSA